MRLRPRTVFALIAILAGCGGPSEAPLEPAQVDPALEIVSGDDQEGEAESTLATPLRIEVLDVNRKPLANVKVFWIVDPADKVEPAWSMTDSLGFAETRWTPLVSGDTRSARARVGLKEVEFHARVRRSSNSLRLTPVTLTTYDGSGQVVHPDVVDVSWLQGPRARVLAVTPYPFGDASKENPSTFFRDFTANEWTIPDGASNPVALPTEGHLSDPDIVDDPDAQQLRLYYRGAGSKNTLWMKSSNDGRDWSKARLLLTTSNHEMVSPTFVRRTANQWEMWSVNSGERGCTAYSTFVERRTSPDGYTWSEPETVRIGSENHEVWHLEVQYLEEIGLYLAVYSAKSHSDCTTAAMYVSTSRDGVTWQPRANPLLVRGAIPEFSHIVYRSSFVFNAEREEFTFWHSGAAFADNKWTWRMATERRKLQDVLNPPAAMIVGVEPSPAPKLLIAP